MKKFILATAALAAFFSSAQAGISVHQIPISRICFDTVDEAWKFHVEHLKEVPVALGKRENGMVMVFANKDKPSWTIVVSAINENTTHTCAFFTGTEWKNMNPDNGGDDSTGKIPI